MRLDEGITSSRNLGVELLRVLCVMYIIGFWHLLFYTDALPGYNNIATATITDIILGTFIFISGYFVARKPIEPTIKGILSFYKAKLLRIYPLYLLALASFTVLGLTTLQSAIKAAVFISMFFKPAPHTLWFITMLMFFFVITPFLLILVEKISPKRLYLYAGIFLLLLLGYYFAFKLLDVRIIIFAPTYLAAVLLAREKIAFPRWNLGMFLILAGCLLFSIPNLPSGAITLIANAPLVAVSSIGLFAYFSKIRFTSARWLPFITFISYSSYSMYLFHRPFFIMMKTIFFPFSGVAQIACLLLLFFPFVIIFSYDLQKLYDMFLTYVGKAKRNTTPKM